MPKFARLRACAICSDDDRFLELYVNTDLSIRSGDVLRVRDIGIAALRAALECFSLNIVEVDEAAPIPGSYWGESEAGLVRDELFVRADTPVHSALHEACHFICMDAERRVALERDAGGDFEEENAVCYLQILLADRIALMGTPRMLADMDAWGYTFRLGSAGAWFANDASDAERWLIDRALIDTSRRVLVRVR